MKKIEVRKTRNGNGIFTTSDFAKDEDIFEVNGTLISCDEVENLDEGTRSNTFRFNEDWYLNPAGELGDFLNHSCEPNSAVVKREAKLFIVAIKNIENGDEITIDYSTIIAGDDNWVMECNCGSPNCRGLIGQFKKLPEEKKKEYLISKMVPEYILS